jgi:hypothetical protein
LEQNELKDLKTFVVGSLDSNMSKRTHNGSRRPKLSGHCVVMFVLMILATAAWMFGLGKDSEIIGGSKKGFLYLERNDSDPVIDYEGANEPDPVHPEFLYSPDAGPRVVNSMRLGVVM